jgi:hypothetical protein
MDRLHEERLAHLKPTLRVEGVYSPADTPIREYLAYIRRGIFPWSYGAEFYPHDAVDHGVGAKTIKEKPWAIYAALIDDAMMLEAEGHPVAFDYQVALGEGIDGYTTLPSIVRYNASGKNGRY